MSSRRYDTTLYRFSSNGAMQWSTNFPEATPGSSGTGAAPAAPNIWRSGEIEVIIVPARYDTDAGRDVHLTTFSSNGALLFDHFVTRLPYPGVTVGCYPWVCGVGFDASDPAIQVAMRELGPPLPSVAMVARSGAPEVVVADGYQYVVGYTFSPATGFQETFRKHITNDERGIGMTSPVILRDGHSVLGGWTNIGENQAWLLFAGPHPNNLSEIVLEDATLIPSLTADGRILTLATTGVTAWRTHPRVEGALVASMRLSNIRCTSNELAEPCFISLGNALLTFDANTFQRVGYFEWQGGGRSSPAIGADGRVYAMAGETLYVFPAPPCRLLHACPGEVTVPGGNVVFHPQILSRTKSRHRFSRPRQRGRAAGCHNRGWRRSSDRSSGARRGRRQPVRCSPRHAKADRACSGRGARALQGRGHPEGIRDAEAPEADVRKLMRHEQGPAQRWGRPAAKSLQVHIAVAEYPLTF